MSSEAQAGTSAAKPGEEQQQAQNPAQPADDSGLNAQQKKEWMTLKQKAEDFNRLAEEKKMLEARVQQMERMGVGQGRGQATDPEADDIAALREQAAYDPMARELLRTKTDAALARAEAWLSDATASVQESKRDKVKAMIRNSGFQMSVAEATSFVTDPETKTLAESLEEARKEIDRLKNAKPHGTSPASALPATANADEGGGPAKEIKRSEYVAALRQGGQHAHDLMQAVSENRTKLIPD